jgi:hypothetical protein
MAHSILTDLPLVRGHVEKIAALEAGAMMCVHVGLLQKLSPHSAQLYIHVVHSIGGREKRIAPTFKLSWGDRGRGGS